MATPEQDRATVLSTAYQATIKSIQGNTSLSGEGKRIAIAKQYVATKDQLTALSEQQTTKSRKRQADLERNLFGLRANAPTVDTVSYRDALDRVSNLDWQDGSAPRDLDRMYTNAQLSADTILTKAILSQAFAARLEPLVERYIADNPAAEADVVELWTAQASTTNLVDNWAFVIYKPSELGALDDTTIRALAEG
ncbi:hypothetical protein [Frondihabitans sp. Leaf304]|uniref:hypothetical protein n=1 Tax=Frondihabitans sp. Leaf304 TaxID=1736329 RepID=UPI0012FB170D|nr:hypothetical protein [Frondihabitans sp. Leaf304]